MFGSSSNGARAYAKVGLETGVLAADPHQLVIMLFEGALSAIASAAACMQAGQVEKKGLAISKAINIIQNGMRASLDHQAGGDIAAGLDSLYDYMTRRLATANLKNEVQMLHEVSALLQDLKSAWEAIGNKPTPGAGTPDQAIAA